MAERKRSTNTYSSYGFVDYADGTGEFREIEMIGPITSQHRERGNRLRRARIDLGLSLREHVDRAALPDFGMVALSQVQAGTVEASEEEWAALWRTLGQEELA